MIRQASLVALGALFLTGVPDAGAQEVSDLAIVGSQEGSGNAGRLAVNMAAGSENQQLSSAALAIGQIGDVQQQAIQRGQSSATDRSTAVLIEGAAFSGNSGLVSLNISAGSQNQSANLAAFAIGQSGALSDQFLEQSRAPIEPPGGPVTDTAAPNDTVSISDDAFAQGSGLFQANLIGGERNSSANTFSLMVSAGE